VSCEQDALFARSKHGEPVIDIFDSS
jgi:hypothetical protein